MYTSACTPHVIQWNQLMGRVDSRMCVKQKVGTHWGIWTGALEWSWLCNRRNNFHMLWSVRDQQMGNVKSTAIGEERRPSNLKMCRRRSWEVKCSFPREHASFHVDCIHLVFHFPVERETRSKVNLSQTGFPNFGIQSRPEQRTMSHAPLCAWNTTQIYQKRCTTTHLGLRAFYALVWP